MKRTERHDKAEVMRASGKSYAEIGKELGVSKSTLSYWFRATTNYDGTSEKQKEHLKRIRALAHQSLKKRGVEQKEALQKKIHTELSKTTTIDIFAKKVALSMLYWAEGKKSKGGGVDFANTDPMIIGVFVSLLEQVFDIKRSKIKLTLYIHAYHDENECKKFWSGLIGIGMHQFNKTYVKPRSSTKKFRENFRGVCFVYYPNSDIRKEILEIGRQFCARITLP